VRFNYQPPFIARVPTSERAMAYDSKRLVANLECRAVQLKLRRAALLPAEMKFTGIVLKKRNRGPALMFLDLRVADQPDTARVIEVMVRGSPSGVPLSRQQVKDFKRDLKPGDECAVTGSTLQPATDDHPCVLHCTSIEFLSLRFGGNAGENRRVTPSEHPCETAAGSGSGSSSGSGSGRRIVGGGQELLHGARAYGDAPPPPPDNRATGLPARSSKGQVYTRGADETAWGGDGDGRHERHTLEANAEVPMWVDPDPGTPSRAATGATGTATGTCTGTGSSTAYGALPTPTEPRRAALPEETPTTPGAKPGHGDGGGGDDDNDDDDDDGDCGGDGDGAQGSASPRRGSGRFTGSTADLSLRRCSPRARVLARWLLATVGRDALARGSGVLDVAGGKGEVSMALSFLGVRSTLVDPRARASSGQLARRQRKLMRKTGRAFARIDVRFSRAAFRSVSVGRLWAASKGAVRCCIAALLRTVLHCCAVALLHCVAPLRRARVLPRLAERAPPPAARRPPPPPAPPAPLQRGARTPRGLLLAAH
jgi:hypothetical protein